MHGWQHEKLDSTLKREAVFPEIKVELLVLLYLTELWVLLVEWIEGMILFDRAYSGSSTKRRYSTGVKKGSGCYWYVQPWSLVVEVATSFLSGSSCALELEVVPGYSQTKEVEEKGEEAGEEEAETHAK